MEKVEVLYPSEARKLLRIGKSTMQKLLQRDDFPAEKIGARWYINKSQLIEWINNQNY